MGQSQSIDGGLPRRISRSRRLAEEAADGETQPTAVDENPPRTSLMRAQQLAGRPLRFLTRNRTDRQGNERDQDDDAPPSPPGDPPSLMTFMDGHSVDEETLMSIANSNTPTTPDGAYTRHTVPSSPPELLQQMINTEDFDDFNVSRLSAIDASALLRRSSICSIDSNQWSAGPDIASPLDDDAPFYPIRASRAEWMGRSIESLILGYSSRAPILGLGDLEYPEELFFNRRRSTASTFGGGRRSSLGGLRGSLGLPRRGHGGTLAYYSRRGSASNGPMYRRRSSLATVSSPSIPVDGGGGNLNSDRPNVVFSLLARESTGRGFVKPQKSLSDNLIDIGGPSLHNKVDSGGIIGEVNDLAVSIRLGDWAETQHAVHGLAPRLIGDPLLAAALHLNQNPPPAPDDPNLPPNTPQYHAGGGRLGLEREAFCAAGGIEVLLDLFFEKAIVGLQVATTHDARDASPELVATRFSTCWNEALASLRELVFSMPRLVHILVHEHDHFLPFLFTLLHHDACFDCTVALIEEILGLLSQSKGQATFYLGRVPRLYELWHGFTCRQLAHFCRILALLIFEPEDRQLIESSKVLKSMGLLQLRRNRAVRSGRDSTVDMNQAILLGDETLVEKMLQLLSILNYAPGLQQQITPQHVLTSYPFVPDTLVMLGLNELDNWQEVRRLLELGVECAETPSKRGKVATMLQNLYGSLERHSNTTNANTNAHQFGYIVRVIAAAREAGIVGGREGNTSQADTGSSPSVSVIGLDSNTGTPASANLDGSASLGDATSVESLASVAGILTDRFLSQRATNGESETHHISSSEDAANSLQFNAIMLGPYQVEILFVLCTLLGGRRKLDAQDSFRQLGLLPILQDLFDRLPWSAIELEDEPSSNTSSDLRQGQAHSHSHHHHHDHGDNSEDGGEENQGIHGPGCECTPESALCVQYLRLLHNFCDRDCDNYQGRRLLLSEEEKSLIFESREANSSPRPGLLTKIIRAFCRESEESPYRFWLASCIESYLRGSSPEEQVFAARSGLLQHLFEDITSDRLHCAGSLQTSFDLLGEMGKGNEQVVQLLVEQFDEQKFRKLMSVAAANLVDSNVFIRSLILTLERVSSSENMAPLFMGRQKPWIGQSGSSSRSYLTHSWWDAIPLSLDNTTPSEFLEVNDTGGEPETTSTRPSDWFPAFDTVESSRSAPLVLRGQSESVGHFGWVFSPADEFVSEPTYRPNTTERLSWFLAANQTRLLRDLLGVVDLQNINHENICCLNTAVVIAIFAGRRTALSHVVSELRKMGEHEEETKRRSANIENSTGGVDTPFVQAMKHLDLSERNDIPAFARGRRASLGGDPAQHGGARSDVVRNFREVLWFWLQYYAFRGRDRLSLEFSSHIRFQEWSQVVSQLVADDDSSASLVSSPVRLPCSPYKRAATVVAESPLRGE